MIVVIKGQQKQAPCSNLRSGFRSSRFEGGAVNRIIRSVAVVALLISTPAMAAPPAPVASWTGFYVGGEFGAGWSSQAVNFSPNDPAAAVLFNTAFVTQPPASDRVSQSGPVGGIEAGYNWQAGPNLLVGFETDFNLSGMTGQASTVSIAIAPNTQTTTAEQRTDWYGSIRGRAGFLATPNLLLFGTGGFAYGRVADAASYSVSGIFHVTSPNLAFSVLCQPNITCFSGASSATRTGWTAGAGAEWLLDGHWSAKLEYQFVDLGSEITRVTAFATNAAGAAPASLSAAFRDEFHVVRAGLNYRY